MLCLQSLHKVAPLLEGTNICSVEAIKLSPVPFILEAVMPVSLDATRIVGWDNVNGLDIVWP